MAVFHPMTEVTGVPGKHNRVLSFRIWTGIGNTAPLLYHAAPEKETLFRNRLPQTRRESAIGLTDEGEYDKNREEHTTRFSAKSVSRSVNMKAWIKILALGLVLCMTVAMIAACGAPAAQGNESGTEAGQETARETEKDTEGQPGKETETDKPGDKETVKETDKATETEPETDPPVTQSAFGQPLAKYTRPFASNDATYFTGVTQDDEGLLFSIGSANMVYKPASIVYDISGYTHFEFDLYVEDSEALRNLGGTSQIELTSGGQNDKGELSIEPPKSFIPKIEDGWNHVSISLSDMAAMADFDPTGINYLRWYWAGTDGAKVDTIVKDMKFTNPTSTDAPAGYFEIEGQTFNWEAKSEIYKVNQNTREKLPFMFEDKAHWNANQVFCDGGAYVIFKFPAAEYRTPVFTFDICQNYRLEISNDGSEWVELLNYSTEDGVTGPISSADNRKTVEIDPAEYGLSSDEDVLIVSQIFVL